jgi:molybdenum cofactor cytidylyltransferase
MPIAIILLAAGASSRMGTSKQMMPVHGTPMLRSAVDIALHSKADRTVVVLGSNHIEHARLINDQKVSTVVNDRWSRGMGGSLKVGLNAVLSLDPSTEAVVVMLCDQPAVTSEYLNSLIDIFNLENKGIVASYYANAAGVPALFSRDFFQELSSMKDDGGAKSIIQKNSLHATHVDFARGVIDLDTPDDYRKFTS